MPDRSDGINASNTLGSLAASIAWMSRCTLTPLKKFAVKRTSFEDQVAN
jgi:hypothetical protein